MSPQTTRHTCLPAARPGSAVTLTLLVLLVGARGHGQSASVNNHPVVLDGQQKIVTWMTPPETAFDRFLDQRWDFIKTSVPMSPGPAPRSSYPMYYFFSGYLSACRPSSLTGG